MMTTPTVTPEPTPLTAPSTTSSSSRGTWRLSWSGLRTVATLELRQRVRSTRWIAILALWAATLAVLAGLIRFTVFQGFSYQDDATAAESAGAWMFGLIVMLVLSLGALISPAMSATSINGDRSAGVLATLQTTLLSPLEIALGKLAAAWLTSLALLAVASPFILWGFFSGGTSAGRLVTSLGLLSIMLLVVCAIGLGWSSVTARTTSSAVLTYLTVAFVGLGMPVLFGLLVPVVSTTERATVRQMMPVSGVPMEPPSDGTYVEPVMQCQETTEIQTRVHTEWIWWLLAADPYVVVADASPRSAGVKDDLLSIVRSGVREVRLGEPPVTDYCYDSATWEQTERERARERDDLSPTWPYGLAADLALGAGFFVVAVRRLRTPSRKLARGTRVA